MVKILVACANGAGTSLMMKMRVEKATKDLGIQVQTITAHYQKGRAQQLSMMLCSVR